MRQYTLSIWNDILMYNALHVMYNALHVMYNAFIYLTLSLRVMKIILDHTQRERFVVQVISRI